MNRVTAFAHGGKQKPTLGHVSTTQQDLGCLVLCGRRQPRTFTESMVTPQGTSDSKTFLCHLSVDLFQN